MIFFESWFKTSFIIKSKLRLIFFSYPLQFSLERLIFMLCISTISVTGGHHGGGGHGGGGHGGHGGGGHGGHGGGHAQASASASSG